MGIIKFNTLEIGTFETDAVVVAINQSNTSNNKPMLKVTLSDGEDNITALIFDSTRKAVRLSSGSKSLSIKAARVTR